jgi:acyl-CoA synthetase (AMP-forming)/AMP-acid ligase II
MVSLLDYLGEHPIDTCLISRGGEGHVAGDLIRDALDLRSQHAQLANRAVALRHNNSLTLVRHLIALDGFARRIFLVPPGVPDAAAKSLLSAAEVRGYLTDQGTEPLAVKSESQHPEFEVTEWLLATSGTTGTPKIVVHTLGGLANRVNRNRAKGAEFVWGLLYDPNRFAGLQVVLQSLIGGSRLILSSSDHMETSLVEMAAGGVNALSATPSLWRKILMSRAAARCRLRQVTLGGEIADQAVLDALKERFPSARITHIYASTEAGVGFSVNDGRAGFPGDYIDLGVSGCRLRVDDAGYLYIKPPSRQQHFLDPGRRLVGDDGFINTQDLVCCNGDRVYFLGRANGAINVGGIKVHPEEVEGVIRAVAGVHEVLVFGKSSSILGQLVAAKVVAAADTDATALRTQIVDACRKCLDNYKVPTAIQFVGSLESNSAGKLSRTTL